MEYVVLVVMGWFCWMSTILVNEKKERQRRERETSNSSR